MIDHLDAHIRMVEDESMPETTKNMCRTLIVDDLKTIRMMLDLIEGEVAKLGQGEQHE
jgi:hypothetical protein